MNISRYCQYRNRVIGNILVRSYGAEDRAATLLPP
jgi:hypothetical protein